MPIITIAAPIGSLGERIAERVARRLACPVVEFKDFCATELKPLMQEKSWRLLQESPKFYVNLNPEEVFRASALKDETIQQRLRALRQIPSFGEQGDLSLRGYLSQRLQERAHAEGMVYLGFGGPFFFDGCDEAIHLQILCPEVTRLNRLARLRKLPTATAKTWLEQSDRAEQRHMTIFFHTDMNRPELYDAVYNSERLSVSGISDSILALQREQEVQLQTQVEDSVATDRLKRQFKNESEEEFAQLLDAYHLEWRYEPRSFPIEWNEDGQVCLAFSPDFYLPRFDLYLELTTMDQRYVTEKNQKVKKLQELYPDVKVRVVYKKDFESMLQHFRMHEVDSGEV